MYRILIAAFALLVLSSCATIYEYNDVQEDGCIFRIQMTHSSGSGVVHNKHGVYVYLSPETTPEDYIYEFVNVAVYRNGKEVAFIGGGTSISHKITSSIREAKLPNIDYEELMKSTSEKVAREGGSTIDVMGGSKYEIVVNYKESNCRLRMWNPVPKIEHLAEHDETLNRLNSVISTIVNEVGKDQIDI